MESFLNQSAAHSFMPLRPADLARGALVPLRWMCEGRDSHECDIDIRFLTTGRSRRAGGRLARSHSIGPLLAQYVYVSTDAHTQLTHTTDSAFDGPSGTVCSFDSRPLSPTWTGGATVVRATNPLRVRGLTTASNASLTSVPPVPPRASPLRRRRRSPGSRLNGVVRSQRGPASGQQARGAGRPDAAAACQASSHLVRFRRRLRAGRLRGRWRPSRTPESTSDSRREGSGVAS